MRRPRVNWRRDDKRLPEQTCQQALISIVMGDVVVVSVADKRRDRCAVFAIDTEAQRHQPAMLRIGSKPLTDQLAVGMGAATGFVLDPAPVFLGAHHQHKIACGDLLPLPMLPARRTDFVLVQMALDAVAAQRVRELQYPLLVGG